jgi:hypothetical protein
LACEVEERIHKALASHPLERTPDGYRLVHPSGAGVSTIRFVPVEGGGPGEPVAAVAEIVAEYRAAGLPSFHAAGIQRLNAMAVHGAYESRTGQLRQTAQFSIYTHEPASHLAVQSILNAFGAQLPIGLSVALGTASEAALERQRAHHAMPRQWKMPVEPQALEGARELLQKRGLAASNNTQAVWAELPLSGDCPSRAIDPGADTVLMQVTTGVAHPIAGAGYFSSISLPLKQAPADAAELCRRLNVRELQMIDFPPRIGAWGLHGPEGLPGYSCFIPSSEAQGGLHLAIMWWLVRRAAWLRDRFWIARNGISLEALADAASA